MAAEDQGFLDTAAQTVASRRGWPRDWLNDGVRTYLSPQAQGFAQHTLFRTYPNEERPGLRVFVPTAQYMLAMKLMALRIDEGGARNDLEDILNDRHQGEGGHYRVCGALLPGSSRKRQARVVSRSFVE